MVDGGDEVVVVVAADEDVVVAAAVVEVAVDVVVVDEGWVVGAVLGFVVHGSSGHCGWVVVGQGRPPQVRASGRALAAAAMEADPPATASTTGVWRGGGGS